MEVLVVLRRSFFMNVFIRRVTRRVIILKHVENGASMLKSPPEDGYWEILWTRKTDAKKEITGALHKKTAERIAAVLNALSKMEAKELVTTFRR